METLHQLFSSSIFMPHGMCYLWTRPLLILHVGSDALIAICYALLPITLFYLVRNKRDIPFNWMFVLFLIFITFCGLYHLLEIVTIWYPLYWISGINKIILGVGSIMTAILLTQLIPKALALPSPQALAEANACLSKTNDSLKLLSEHLSEARDKAVKVSILKSQFLANTSHEFRTPMAGVLGLTELLQDTDLTPEQKEILLAVEVSGRALLTTINNVLVFSTIEAGKLEIENIPFSIQAMIATSVNQSRPSARKKGISIKKSIDKKVASIFRGDPERLGQVLNNLLESGVQFGGAEEVELKVTVDSEDAVKQCVLFEVSAQGIVLAGGDQLHLAPPKVNDASSETSSSAEIISSANLGLSICKKLVELMGGTLSAKGGTTDSISTFLFRLNLQKATDPDIEIQAAMLMSAHALRAYEEEELILPGPVLVVDASRVQREILVAQLERLGVTVHSADSRSKAIDLIAKTDYCAVLMDCHMPEIDGCQASQTIRIAQESGDRRPLIIGMTASSGDGERDKCIDSGMDNALTKPIALDQLRKVLEGRQ